jgi:hypothetical protein
VKASRSTSHKYVSLKCHPAEGLPGIRCIEAAAHSPIPAACGDTDIQRRTAQMGVQSPLRLAQSHPRSHAQRRNRLRCKALTGMLVSQRMDRAYPPWDLALVRGLMSNRASVVFRIDHCLADGVFGVGLMSVLMEPSPKSAPAGRQKTTHRATCSPETGPGAMIACSRLFFHLQSALTAHSEVLNIVQNVISAPARE